MHAYMHTLCATATKCGTVVVVEKDYNLDNSVDVAAPNVTGFGRSAALLLPLILICPAPGTSVCCITSCAP